MLVRAGRFAFRKLSIPRDTFASIPGHDAQKINAAYAFGGAKLEVQTVEQFLGIDVDQVAVVDFDGFRDFIDAIGGVDGGHRHEGLLGDLGRSGERRLQPLPRSRASTT